MHTLTAKAVITRASCSQKPVVVNVAASADIAPAVQAAARAFNRQNFTAGGRCAEIQVTGGASGAEAGQIDGQAALSGATPIDAWIPDSSLWVDVARSYPIGAQNVQPTGKSVARSPLLLVTTPAVANSTHVLDAQPGWGALLPPDYGGPPRYLHLAVDLPDPNSSATGLATLIQVSRRLGISATARSALTKFVFSVESTEDFDSATALQDFVHSTEPPFDRR